MSSLIDMMAFEVNKTIHNYEEKNKIQVAKIILVGGLANMLNFQEYFSQRIGREVSQGNPLARIVIPPALESLRGELSANFMVSVGLAMRPI